nr:FMRFamide-related peptide [Locusta migratoria]
GQERNFLRF